MDKEDVKRIAEALAGMTIPGSKKESMKISLKDYTEKFHLVPESNTIIADASDLEFPVGQWPRTLEIEAVNGIFHYQLMSLTENVAHYYSPRQPKLKIFND